MAWPQTRGFYTIDRTGVESTDSCLPRLEWGFSLIFFRSKVPLNKTQSGVCRFDSSQTGENRRLGRRPSLRSYIESDYDAFLEQEERTSERIPNGDRDILRRDINAGIGACRDDALGRNVMVVEAMRMNIIRRCRISVLEMFCPSATPSSTKILSRSRWAIPPY